MPQQLLDAAQIGAGVEQMRGERVPQRVRRHAGPQRGGADVAVEQPAHASRGDAVAPVVDEQRVAQAAVCLVPDAAELISGFGRTAADQQLSLFWYNGVEWVKSGGQVNTADDTVSLTGTVEAVFTEPDGEGAQISFEGHTSTGPVIAGTAVVALPRRTEPGTVSSR